MISRTGTHAIRALACLACREQGEYAGAGAIAERIGAPANYLGKLLQTLARHDLVESRKGVGGGFRLARPADRINLLDVLGPIEQIDRWDGCVLGGPSCSDDAPCAMHDRWATLRREYRALLLETTIASIRNQAGSDSFGLPCHDGG